MAIIKTNWNPGTRDLRVFGIAALVLTALLSVLLYIFKDLPMGVACGIAGFGIFTFACSLVLPGIARLIYRVLMAITLPIGVVVSFLLMAVLYYLVITPLGMVFGVIGRDALRLRRSANAASYWVPRKRQRELKRYFHQS